MSRRTLQHPIGRLAKAQSRMAPGGMVWSESPIPRRFSPRVPMVGGDEATDPPDPEVPSIVLRPVLLEPWDVPSLNLVGDAGDATFADDLITTYAQTDFTWPPFANAGSVRATFDTPDIDFTPDRAELYISGRSLVGVGGAGATATGTWYVTSPDGGTDFSSYNFHDPWKPGADWGDFFTFWGNGTHVGSSVPSAADVAAGIRILLAVTGSDVESSGHYQVDVADVWLVLTMWPEEAP